MKAQLDSFFLTGSISYSSSRTETIKQLRLDKEITRLKIDFNPDSINSIITTITYCRAGVDSALIKFSKDYLSVIAISFSDSCAFNYCKSYFLENLKIAKKSKTNSSLKFIGKEYNFYLVRGIDKSDPKYHLTIVSRKHQIKI